MNINLRLGDCLDVFDTLEPGSVDAVICDPPYDLTSGGSKGFMGKAWDGTGIAFQVELWAKILRVLKPGGVIKAFSGTRTYHRMVVAMEEAGVEIIPFEAWGYGCLTSDAEILTETGWKPGLEVQVGEQVACWDSQTEAITLQAVEEIIQAPFDGEMVAFANDNTEQLLTPNHRVYKKHRQREMVEGVRVQAEEDTWTVAEAGNINRWNHLRLPLAGVHEGPGIGGADWAAFLAWIWTEGGYDTTGTGVRVYQSSVNMEHVHEIQRLMDMFATKHKLYPRDRAYKERTHTEYTWFFSGEDALRVRGSLPEKRPTWDLLWKMTQEEKHAFANAAVAGDGDGSVGKGKRRKDGTVGPGRVVFYQKNPDDLVWFQTLAHLMNRQGRINFKKRVVGLHMNPTTQLQGRHLKKHTTEPYQGIVWCVRVPTGAFVARRKDKVFITGNSGFPKSLNIGKALDAMLGAERGKKKVPYTGDALLRSGGQNTRPWMEEALKKGYHELAGDEPVTDEAKTWDGWGTALKPAWEPVIVGRKPPQEA